MDFCRCSRLYSSLPCYKQYEDCSNVSSHYRPTVRVKKNVEEDNGTVSAYRVVQHSANIVCDFRNNNRNIYI